MPGTSTITGRKALLAVTAKSQGERAFQDEVIERASALGWRSVHFRPARTAKGWRTAIQGDKGFPDTVLAKGGRLIITELKTETGKLDADQKEWIRILALVAEQGGGLEVYIWRPSQWDDIDTILSGPFSLGWPVLYMLEGLYP